MNPSARIGPPPLLYTDIFGNDRIKHIKCKGKLHSFKNLRKYTPFKNIHRLSLYQDFQGTKSIKNISILKSLAGVTSLKWTNFVKNDNDLLFAYQLIKKYKKLTKLSFDINMSSLKATSKTKLTFICGLLASPKMKGVVRFPFEMAVRLVGKLAYLSKRLV